MTLTTHLIDDLTATRHAHHADSVAAIATAAATLPTAHTFRGNQDAHVFTINQHTGRTQHIPATIDGFCRTHNGIRVFVKVNGGNVTFPADTRRSADGSLLLTDSEHHTAALAGNLPPAQHATAAQVLDAIVAVVDRGHWFSPGETVYAVDADPTIRRATAAAARVFDVCDTRTAADITVCHDGELHGFNSVSRRSADGMLLLTDSEHATARDWGLLD